jgi:acetylornithine/N-succinyldiaminopimelate aminotransferase
LLENALLMGDYMRSMLKAQLTGLAEIREIRGQGLMIGIELSRPCVELVKDALEKGLLINVTSDKVVRLLPPLVIQRAEAELVVSTLSGIVKEFLMT